MIVGVPKEIKNNENRVGMTPAGVAELTTNGHKVLVQVGAGLGSGIADEQYVSAGAEMVLAPKEIFDRSDMIVKVKEPIECEYDLFHEGQILYTYLHLAADKPLTEALMAKKVVSFAYETIQLSNGALPLLTPMSEVAGRMSVQVGANFLEKPHGGIGMLIGGVAGVAPAEVVIIGGGIVGTSAAKMAMGLGGNVTVIDKSIDRLRYLDDVFFGKIKTLASNTLNIAESVKKADLLIGSVLIPGAKAPKLVTEDMVKTMKEGAVVVDVAIDQGGCIGSVDHATTHADPVYVKYGVVHYSVANMPGAVARTSTYALTNSTIGYAVRIANVGWKAAIESDNALALGINVVNGKVTYKAVAEALSLPYTPLSQAI